MEEYAYPRETPYAQNGMTLRDWLAGQALKGLASNCDSYGINSWFKNESRLAEFSYRISDAMMEARKK